jgi:hypothetical protein
VLSLSIVYDHNKVAQKPVGSHTSAVQLAGRYFGSSLDTELRVTNFEIATTNLKVFFENTLFRNDFINGLTIIDGNYA